MRVMLSAIEERLEEPTARGLAHAVSRAIRDEVLTPGTKLPPIRTVAVELALSPTTVSAGWSLLLRSGAIRTDGRRGTTVAERGGAGAVRYRRALNRQVFALDLSTGIPDGALLPDLGPGFARLTTAGTPSSYLDDPVLPELAEVIGRQWPFPPERLTMMDGAMDALDQLVREQLRLGDRVVVEHPCFPPLIDLLEATGVELVGVPVDEEGLSPTHLRAALGRPVAAVFLQPRAHNPTGVSMSRRRAAELAALLRPTDALVVEDDSAGAVASGAPLSLGEWLPERTVHVRSFSKSHGPDLRLAALSAPPTVMDALLARRQLGQGWSSRVLQQLLLGLLTDPGATAAVDHARQVYADRRTRLVQALGRRGISVVGADGINVWLPVHDETAAMVRLASRGIGAAPGTPFRVLPAAGDDEGGHLRVTCGLVDLRGAELERLADELVEASRTGSWAGL